MQLAGRGCWRHEGGAIEGLRFLGIAEPLSPETECVGDQVGDVAGARVDDGQTGCRGAAAARGADQRLDAAGTIGIRPLEPIEKHFADRGRQLRAARSRRLGAGSRAAVRIAGISLSLRPGMTGREHQLRRNAGFA